MLLICANKLCLLFDDYILNRWVLVTHKTTLDTVHKSQFLLCAEVTVDFFILEIPASALKVPRPQVKVQLTITLVHDWLFGVPAYNCSSEIQTLLP